MIYILTHHKWEAQIRLEYHPNGYLKSAEFPEVFDANTLIWFAVHFPTELSILEWVRTNTNIKVEEMIAEITFDEFWAVYNKKTGSKELARQYWDGDKKTINRRPVNDIDRMNIMRVAKRYESRYYGEKKEFQPLATSFLHGRMWESEIEALPRRSEAAQNIAAQVLERWKSVKQEEK